ncbi:MAG TPA: DUF5658 family protein, partial [Candidatus Binatia bacterium]|nr:DUF5658 family protein [Candidatus Binatia bacterium]
GDERTVTRLIPLAAILAVLADGVLTYRAIRRGAREVNPARAWLIQRLGLAGGTWGIALGCAAALLLVWPAALQSAGFATASLAYLTVTIVYAWATWLKVKHRKGRN